MGVPRAALARLAPRIPHAGALPGGTRYEPKWDGIRTLIDRRTPGECVLWSRQGRDLAPAFPELHAAALAQIPDGFVLDGETILWTAGQLDFAALQHRLRSRNAARAARTQPVSFAGFDILAVAGRDVRSHAWSIRRNLLEELAADWTPPLNLSPVTNDPQIAADWFEQYPAVGIEGLVCKGAGEPYRGGVRAWVKVKHRDSVDVICGAVTGTLTQPGHLIVGLTHDGALHVAGTTTALSSQQAAALRDVLTPPRGTHPWSARIHAGAFSDRHERDITRVEPFVIEISADTAWTGTTFRHPVRYLRIRPDLIPADVSPPARLSRSQHHN